MRMEIYINVYPLINSNTDLDLCSTAGDRKRFVFGEPLKKPKDFYEICFIAFRPKVGKHLLIHFIHLHFLTSYLIFMGDYQVLRHKTVWVLFLKNKKRI